MGIKIHSIGNYQNTRRMLIHAQEVLASDAILNKYGSLGVTYLADATPKRTGLTSQSWNYRIERNVGEDKLIFYNTHENKGVNIAIILQYGHGTRFGGYVQGIDYINPPMQKTFKQLADELWLEVSQ